MADREPNNELKLALSTAAKVSALRTVVHVLLAHASDAVREDVVKALKGMSHIADSKNADLPPGPGFVEEATHQMDLAAREMIQFVETLGRNR
jgi:hypothetical protein